MCRGGSPTPYQHQLLYNQDSQTQFVSHSFPVKKELVDPEDIADVEYGTGSGRETKDTRGAAKRTGTDALKNKPTNPRWRKHRWSK